MALEMDPTKKIDEKYGLKKAEDDTAKKEIEEADDSVSGALSAEEDLDNQFTTNVNGPSEQKARMKVKKGPMFAILGLIFGGGFALISGVFTLPFSLIANLQEVFDTLQTSTQLRSDYFFKTQINPKTTVDCRKSTIFGTQKFKLTEWQTKKLKTQGIEPTDFTYTDAGGKTRTSTVFVFDDGSSKKSIITPDETLAARIRGGEIEVDGQKIKIEDNFMGVFSFDRAYDNFPDFRNGYIASSRTWRGSIAAWFDALAVRILKSNKITRNLFKKYQEKVEETGNSKSATIELMKNNVDDEVSMTARVHDEDATTTETRDDNGKVTGTRTEYDIDTESESIKLKTTGATKAEIKAKLDELGAKYKKSASSITSAAVNLTCAVAGFIGAVNLLVVARESMQIMSFVSGLFEAVQKAQAGDGDGSPINEFAIGLTTPIDTEIDKPTFGGKIYNSITELFGQNKNINGDEVDTEKTVIREDMTAMQANAMAALYGNTAVNLEDESVQSFNIGSKLNTILGLIGSSIAAAVSCSIAKLAAAAIGAILDGMTIAFCVISLGIGCIVRAIVDSLGGAIVSVGIALAFTVVTSALLPFLVTVFERDLISDLAGEHLGNAIVSGSNMYMGVNHRAGGGSLSNEQKLIAFKIEQGKVIAEKARFERETLSPFDITSKYTFFGSLVQQIAAFSTTKSSLTGVLASLSNITSNSITALLPSASAISATNFIKNTGDCPYLESIDAKGDAFCNPYIITDVDTLDDNPADIVNTVDSIVSTHNLKNFTDDSDGLEVPKIQDKSNLALYINYCSNRSSSFGVADQNIANDFMSFMDVRTGSTFVNTIGNSVLGAVPVLGDMIDVVQNDSVIKHMGWVSGASCVAGGDEVDTTFMTDSPKWETEGKYYQRFLEDQRLAKAMGLIDKTSEEAYLEEYYKEHPLDNSYEGVLARKSGLTKENVIAILDTIDYYKYLAEYDPTERYHFVKEEKKDDTIFFENNTIAKVMPETIEPKYIIYNDIRNRVATV